MTVYGPGEQGRCPQCLEFVEFEKQQQMVVGKGKKETLLITAVVCPYCEKIVMTVEVGSGKDIHGFCVQEEYIVWPLR